MRRIFDICVEPEKDGGFTVHAVDLPECVSYGDTVHEALDNIKKALRLHLRMTASRGVPQHRDSMIAHVEV